MTPRRKDDLERRTAKKVRLIIGRYRAQHGLSQRELGERIGMTAWRVSALERGQAQINTGEWWAFCRLSQTPPSVLVEDWPPKHPR